MWYSVVPSQQTHPATVICISMERKYSSLLRFKMPNEGRFFPELTVKPRKNLFYNPQFDLYRCIFYFQAFTVQTSVIGGIAVIFVYHQNGEYLVNSWSSVRRAAKSAHKFYSISFYIDVSTFELS